MLCGIKIPSARAKLIEKSEKDAKAGIGVQLQQTCIGCQEKMERELRFQENRQKARKSFLMPLRHNKVDSLR